MLKIKASILADFLQKIRIPGESGIDEFVLKTDKDGMKCKALSAGVGACGVVAELSRKVFNVFEENLVITVGDGDKLQNFVDRFSDIFDLTVTGNRLVIVSKTKKAEVILASKDFVKDEVKIPDFKFEKYISLEPEIFSDVLKNKTLTKSDYITIEVKNGVLKMLAGEKNFDSFAEKVTGVEYDDVKSAYAAGIESIFGQLTKKCRLALKSNYPMEIKMDDDTMKIKYFIAPRAENTEEETKEVEEIKEKDKEFDKKEKEKK